MLLTSEDHLAHNGRVGRKKMEGAALFTLRLTPEDKAFAEAVQKANGLSDLGSSFRYAVRELARRDRLKVDTAPTPPKPGTSEGE